jgi:hypothetical protein
MAAAAATVDFSGLSIRQAWELWMQNSVTAKTSLSFAPPFGYVTEANDESTSTPFLTVDFYNGVRFHPYMGAYGDGTGAFGFSDYTALVISNTPGGTLSSNELTWETDSSPTSLRKDPS